MERSDNQDRDLQLGFGGGGGHETYSMGTWSQDRLIKPAEKQWEQGEQRGGRKLGDRRRVPTG